MKKILEREIENLLEQQLLKNNWIIDFQNIDRNVYHQSTKTSEESEKL
jgi:hypothetical protein